MNLEVIANATGSTPAATVAVEPQDQSPTNDVMLFEVTVVSNVQLTLSGCVNVYANDPDEALEKVQRKIDDEALDDDLDMEDDWSGATLPYGHLKGCSNIDFQAESVEIIETELDPAEVLEAEVEELAACVNWNADALAKHKAFLESLLSEDDDEQAVSA